MEQLGAGWGDGDRAVPGDYIGTEGRRFLPSLVDCGAGTRNGPNQPAGVTKGRTFHWEGSPRDLCA